MASSQTTRKANITSDQLGRRYKLIYDAIETKKMPFNLAEIVRWYGAQPQEVRNSLEKTEPFTWLKHLDKCVSKVNRSPRHLSALIMEEFFYPQQNRGRIQTIPEDLTMPDSITTSYPQKAGSHSFSSRAALNAQNSPLSTHLTTDDRISFEPFAESKRRSLDAHSRKSAESVPNSGSSNALPLSPVSSRVNDSDRNPRSRLRASSPGSSSPDSSDDSYSRLRGPLNFLTVPEVSLQPPSSEALASGNLDPIPISVNPSTGSSGSSQKKSALSHAAQSMISLKESLGSRKARMSLPSPERIARRNRRRREAREEQLKLEYDSKSK
jgi:hypothetical protein